MPKTCSLLILLTLLSCWGSAVGAVEIRGKVTAVSRSTTEIEVTSEELPAVGDELEIFVEIPGVGKATVASGRVASIAERIVRAKIEDATATVRVGQLALIHSNKPAAHPNGKVPALIGRLAASAKLAIEQAGYQATIKLGIKSPEGITPLTVYAQDPPPGTDLVSGGRIMITIYADSSATSSFEARPSSAGTMAKDEITSADPRDNRYPPWPTIKPGQAWLGVGDMLHGSQLMLTGVLLDGPAGKAGLQAGDIVLSVNGLPLGEHWLALHTRIAAFTAGDTVQITIERRGDSQSIQVVLEQIPPDGGIGRLVDAAESGTAWAMAELGLRYLAAYRQWSYVEKDMKLGLMWLRRANEADSALGALRLAMTYFGHDPAFEKDLAKVKSLLERARKLADPAAYSAVYNTATESLASLYKTGQGVPEDAARAVSLYRDLAERGVASSAYYLAEMLAAGQGTEKDAAQALRWYHVAAQQGHDFAQTTIGSMAYKGEVVEQDYETACKWFRLAAESNNSIAMLYLGEAYQYGRGVPQNFREAARWYNKTAGAAFTGSTIGLATRMEAELCEFQGAALGFGPAEARREAIRLYRKAAKWNEQAKQALERLGVSAEATVIAGWGEVIDPDGDCKIEEVQNGISISVPGSRHDLYLGNTDPSERNNAPRVVQDVAGDFTAQVKVTADWKLKTPLPNGQNTIAAGLLVIASTDHFVRHERILFRHRQLGTEKSFAPPIYDRNGRRLSTIKVVDPTFFQGDTTWFRIVRRGPVISTFISHDGENWEATQAISSQLPDLLQVGVHVINASGNELVVKFDQYELHGALPYQVGEKVVVIRDRQLSGAGSSMGARVFPGLVANVEAIQGSQLTISNGRAGGIERTDVIRFDNAALERFTKLIQQSPEDPLLHRARGLVYAQLDEFDASLEDMNESLRLDSSAWYLHNGRGNVRLWQGEFEAAIDDFTNAIGLHPNTISFNNRGHARLDHDDFRGAIQDFDACLRFDPEYTFAYEGRGEAWRKLGDYHQALADFDKARQLDSTHYRSYRNSAWLRSTCPDESFRDGELAVQEATRACELSGWTDATCLGVLAAAYAERGDFDEAVRWQVKAVEGCPQQLEDAYRDRLKVYRQGRPYRDHIEP